MSANQSSIAIVKIASDGKSFVKDITPNFFASTRITSTICLDPFCLLLTTRWLFVAFGWWWCSRRHFEWWILCIWRIVITTHVRSSRISTKTTILMFMSLLCRWVWGESISCRWTFSLFTIHGRGGGSWKHWFWCFSCIAFVDNIVSFLTCYWYRAASWRLSRYRSR